MADMLFNDPCTDLETSQAFEGAQLYSSHIGASTMQVILYIQKLQQPTVQYNVLSAASVSHSLNSPTRRLRGISAARGVVQAASRRLHVVNTVVAWKEMHACDV